MYPVLLKIGPLTLHTYGLLVATGLLLGISLALREGKKVGYDPQVIMDMVFYIVLAGIIGSRVLYLIQNFSDYRDHPVDMLKIWQGGLSFHGALLFALPVGWSLMKKAGYPFWGFFDVLAPSIAIGQAMGRVGCFFAGCCHGAPTTLPWAVTFHNPQSLAPTGIPLHPAQLYTAGALVIIFFILIRFRHHARFTGQVACLYLMLHSAFRFGIEFVRADERLFLWNHAISVTQLISVLLFLAGLIMYGVLRQKHQARV